jgi:tetratricopeptide (TPR) repeat protein
MQDRFEEAFISYDKAIQLRPERASAWVGRGMARKALGDTDNAMADFEISYRIFPNRIASKELRNYVPQQTQANQALAPSTTDEEALSHPDDPDSPDFATRHEGQLVDVATPLAPTQSTDGSEPTAEPASIP